MSEKKKTTEQKKTTKEGKILRRLFNDLVRDLSIIDGASARTLQGILDKIPDTQLASDLRDETSHLVHNIPLKLLEGDVNGKKYIDLFKKWQPSLSPAIPNIESAMKNIESMSEMLSEHSLDPSKNEDIKDLYALATAAYNDLNIEESMKEDGFNLGSIMKIASDVPNYLNEKIRSGEIDSEKICKQAELLHMNLAEKNKSGKTGDMSMEDLSMLSGLFS